MTFLEFRAPQCYFFFPFSFLFFSFFFDYLPFYISGYLSFFFYACVDSFAIKSFLQKYILPLFFNYLFLDHEISDKYEIKRYDSTGNMINCLCIILLHV